MTPYECAEVAHLAVDAEAEILATRSDADLGDVRR